MKQNAYKKLLVAVFAMCVATGAYAQDPVEKGAWLFNGGSNLGYSSTSVTGGGSSSAFAMSLKGGYFFMDNLAAGVLFDMYSPSGGTSQTGFGIFARYYFNGQIFVGAGFESVDAGGGSVTYIPIEAGYAMFFGKSVAVEPGIQFTSYDGGSEFGVRVGFSVYLGRGE
jgi:hypothetical protein